MRPHSRLRLPHPFLIIGSKMGRFSPWLGRVCKFTGWIWESSSSVFCTRFQLLAVSSATPAVTCGPGEPLLLTGQLQSRCSAGSHGRNEYHIASKCLGKECKTGINTKHAVGFLQFVCRAFSAGSCSCILVLNRLSWAFLPECLRHFPLHFQHTKPYYQCELRHYFISFKPVA